jgi:hypothetical protein
MKAIRFKDYETLRGYSYNQFSRWITNFYMTAYNAGKRSVEEQFSLTDSDTIVTLDENELVNIILSVKGVGENRARQIADKIYGGVSDG